MYERHKCSMCTHSKAAISVQDNANTMEILSNKNKINALFIVISCIQRPVPPKCLDRKANTRNFFFSLCLQLSSLSSICLFCRSIWSSHFLSPYLLSLPVTLLCILRLCHSLTVNFLLRPAVPLFISKVQTISFLISVSSDLSKSHFSKF